MIETRVGISLISFDFHPESETYRARYDQTTTKASMAVVAVMTEVLDVPWTEFKPLQSVVDTDALDALVTEQATEHDDSNVTIRLEGYAVTVHNDGLVTVVPLDSHQNAEYPTK